MTIINNTKQTFIDFVSSGNQNENTIEFLQFWYSVIFGMEKQTNSILLAFQLKYSKKLMGKGWGGKKKKVGTKQLQSEIHSFLHTGCSGSAGSCSLGLCSQ